MYYLKDVLDDVNESSKFFPVAALRRRCITSMFDLLNFRFVSNETSYWRVEQLVPINTQIQYTFPNETFDWAKWVLYFEE